MKVIVTLNGSITSEASAIYAIHYCQLFGYVLELLHVRNSKDPLAEVENSMENIKTLAEAVGVVSERVVLKGKGIAPLVAYARTNRIAIIFCTARAKKGFFATSFSDYLTRASIPCEIGVIRIADLAAVGQVQQIGLSIRDANLSVEKFTFFASMVHAYESEGEIYSIAAHSPSKRADTTFEEARDQFEQVNHRLAHYRRLAQLQDLKLHIKHAIAESETEQILHHAAHAGYDLLIVGGKRLARFSFFTAVTPLEKLMRHTSVNLIAFYPRSSDND